MPLIVIDEGQRGVLATGSGTLKQQTWKVIKIRVRRKQQTQWTECGACKWSLNGFSA